jgi:hypothetical protein
MNLLQQWGLMALALGGVLGFLRVTNAPLPKFDVNGGTLLVQLPPDWVLLTLTVGGLVLMVIGTSWNAIQKGRQDADEEVPKE